MKLLLLVTLVMWTVEVGRSSDDEKCGSACIMVYAPVCAKDKCNDEIPKKTFSNTCFMKVFNCRNGMNMEVIHEGKCNDDKDDY